MSVGEEIPASGKDGSSVGEGSVPPTGVEVAVLVGVAVAVLVGVAVGVAVGDSPGGGDSVGLGEGLSWVRVNVSWLQESRLG